MKKQTFLYFIVLLSLLNFNAGCAESTLKEPMSTQNGSILERDENGDYNKNIYISRDAIKDEYNHNFAHHMTGNVSNNPGVLVQTFCDNKDENKIDEVISIAKKLKETQEKKIDGVMSIAKQLQETQETEEKKHQELVDLTKHLQTNLDKVVKILSESVSKPANDGKHPAFTGSSYVAIAPPEEIHNFNMSMDVKATEPVTDGIIMYCEAREDHGAGFMSLAVRQGRLEFRFNNGLNTTTIVLTANRTLPANEWTHIEVSRNGHVVVSLRINSGAALEGSLEDFYYFWPNTRIFIGGVDASTDPKHNTAVSGGFKGCIKHVNSTLFGDRADTDVRIKRVVGSANVQQCSNDKWEIF